MSPLVGRTVVGREVVKLPVRLLVVFNPTLEPVVLGEVVRGDVFGIDPSEESESASAGCPMGLELLGGDRGLPMFCRLLSMFSTAPERQ